MRVFPVLGGANYGDDYGAPRSEGRTHQGNDLFAAEGTPLLAVDAGELRFGRDPLGGNVANLYADDGTRYYYAHLSAFKGASRVVKAGEVIGYLGRTGSAAKTDPHLHFEIRPGNAEPVDPYDFLRGAPVESRRTWWPPLALLASVGLAVWAWKKR